MLHADDEPATTNEAARPGTAASPARAAFVSTSASAPPPIDALLGRSVGGLGGQKLRFRPQLFWQEVLPEHAASSCLQFHMDWSSGRNFARQPGDAEVPSNGGYARSVARAVEGSVPEAEARLVGRALREAVRVVAVRVAAVVRYRCASVAALTILLWRQVQQGDDGAAVQHLLSSCYCPLAAVELALCEAAKQGHTEGARLLLAAGAAACAQPVGVGKSALHAAAEAGHEAVARLLVHADPQAIHARSEALAGRTPLQVSK